jgi:leucyl aminopeptidase (aminopeptidase T)
MARSPPTSLEAQFARSVLTQNLQVQPGENVVIEGWSHSLPWAAALARETRRLKAYPVVLYEEEDGFWDSVDAHEEKLLGAAPAHEWSMLGKTDVYIHMWGPGDKLRIAQLPAARSSQLFAWNDTWYRAASKAGLRGARLEIGRPFPTLAKLYGVDLAEWTDQVARASMVNPKKLIASARPIARALETGRRLRIHDEQGTDLTLGLAHRPSMLNAGIVTPKDRKLPFRLLTNLPAGFVAVALDESIADGTLVSNRSCYTDTGRATGVRMEFRDGRLAAQEYATGGELFQESYRKGGKGRDQPGQLRIGLNPELHDTPQLEDSEAGAITVSVGMNRFYPGGTNASRHFGFAVNAGARIEVDGKPLRLPR